MDGTSVEIKDPAAVLAALERAKADAKKFRTEKEASDIELTSMRDKTLMIQTKLKRDKIIKGLEDSGVPNADKLLKYIKIDEINLTDELEIDGLEIQLGSLKSDFPELFDPKRVLGGKANSGVTSEADLPVSASEMQARLVLGK